MSTPNGIVKQNAEYWIKLNLALEIHLKAVLFELLFNKHGNSIYVGLPTNQDLLQQYLIQFRRTKESYLKDFIDWDILCPKEGFTNLEQWNIALVIDVIIHILSIPTPLEGWDQQKPLPDDDSLSGMVLWSRWIHEKIKMLKIDEAGDHYHDMLTTLRYILKTLNYSDLQKFDESIQNDLKSQSIDMVKLFHGQERTEPSASPCKVDFVQKFEICSEILELTVCNGLSSSSPFLTNGSISPTQSASEHKKQPIESSEESSNTNTSENLPNMLVNHSEPQPSSSKQPTESTDDFNFNNTSSIDSLPQNPSPLSNPELQTTAQSIRTKPNNERTSVPPPVATKPKRRTSQQNQERKLSNVVSSQQVDNQTHDSSDRRMSNGLLGQHRSETEFDLKGTILDEVYQIIAEMLTRGEWESMLNTLQLSFKEKFNIFLSSRSIDVFKRRHLSWFDIRNRLLQLDRSDVIKAIKTKTYITEEFQSTLKYHKETLRQNHMTKRFVKPFLGASGEKELDDQNLEDAFVELAIIKGKNVDEKFLNSNRDYHLQQVLLDKQMISLDQLITKDERFVMISGIPGIGKSTLVKKVILDWDKRLLLSGKGPSPNIQILFPILCRELNTIDFTETSSHPLDILERLFPDFLPHWRLIKDVSEHVLFLVDGIDELKGIEHIQIASKRSPAVNLLYHLMNPQFLLNHKCIFVGRPRTIRMVNSFFNLTFQYEVKKVEVCGFSRENVKNYVLKQFKECPQTGHDILLKIQSSPITDGLSRIPFHAWVLTSIFKDNPFMKIPKTATELLLYSFLVYIRRQREKDIELQSEAGGINLKTLANDQSIQQYILSIAHYSFQTLKHSEIVFEAGPTESFLEIEKIGLLVKSTRRETGVVLYQFQHLIFQELFAAIHILRMRENADPKTLNCSILQSCLTIVAGLEGILSTQEEPNQILQGLLAQLTNCDAEASNDHHDTQILSLLQANWMSHWINQPPSRIDIDISDLFIEAFFESQCTTFPLRITIPTNIVVNFTKESDASPLTKYPLYRFYNLLAIFLYQYQDIIVQFFPLFSFACGIKKIEKMISRTQSLYVNTKHLVQEEIIHILTYIFDQLYKLEHFKSLIINFEFSNLDRFILDCIASIFRFKNLESLHLCCLDITEKPRLRWSKNLALLQQSIKQNTSLKKLTLFKCALTDEIILDLIRDFRSLTHLDISYNGLSQITLNRILVKLDPDLTVQVINFSCNHFNQQSTKEFKLVQPDVEGKFPTVEILDITQCQMDLNSTLETEILQNIIKIVRHLRVDRFTSLHPFLDVLGKMPDSDRKLLSIYISGLNEEDEQFIDHFHNIREKFDRFDIQIEILDNHPVRFLELPDWFEMRLNANE